MSKLPEDVLKEVFAYFGPQFLRVSPWSVASGVWADHQGRGCVVEAILSQHVELEAESSNRKRPGQLPPVIYPLSIICQKSESINGLNH